MAMTAALQSMVYGQSTGPTPEKGCAQSTCNFYMMPLALGEASAESAAPPTSNLSVSCYEVSALTTECAPQRSKRWNRLRPTRN